MESDRRDPPKEDPFDFTQLPMEVQYFITDLLPDKSLMNLRATSQTNRALVDAIILRPDNLEKLFSRLTPSQVGSLINVYLTIYSDFADKVKDPLASYLNQLKPNEVIEVMTQFQEINSILNITQYVNDIPALFNNLLNCDQTHLYAFAHKFPNLFQDEMDQVDAPLFKRLIYILTVSDVHDLTRQFMSDTYIILRKYNDENDDLTDRFRCFFSSMAFQTLLSVYLQSAAYSGATESVDAIQLFYESYHQGFVNLKGLDLSYQDWRHLTLTSPNFSEVNLTITVFNEKNLAGLLFIRANLTNADFTAADLTKANFSSADLTKAYFYNANLTNANLSKAILTNTDFSHADLTNCEMYQVDLSTVNLLKANLSGLKLIEPKSLQTADLLNAKLTQLHTMIKEHSQFRKIVKALVEQIYNYVNQSMQSNPEVAKNLLEVALKHNIFKQPNSMLNTIYKPYKAFEKLEKLRSELEKPSPTQGPG